jgi:hypothetical protein
MFSGNYITPENFGFDMYLKRVLDTVTYINSLENKELIYFCKDIVVFYYFAYPELATFKNFAWIKNTASFSLHLRTNFFMLTFSKNQHLKQPGKLCNSMHSFLVMKL